MQLKGGADAHLAGGEAILELVAYDALGSQLFPFRIQALANAKIDLSRSADPESTIAALLAIEGIGPWTAQMIAMRALGWSDAFPAGDLGIRKALKASARDAEVRARAWRPFRAYAAIHLWQSQIT